jgi:hypothetical protein
LQRRAHEVVQRRDRFYAGETAAGDHKSEQRLSVVEGTFGICLFETGRIILARSWIASGSDFMANASSAKPGKLEKLVIEPSASTR